MTDMLTGPVGVIGWDLDDEAWREARKGGLGGSDISAVLGFSTYSSPWEVWADKTGVRSWQDEGSAAADLGVELEPWLIGKAARILDVEVAQTPFRTYAHPLHSWRTCSPDGKTADGRLVECKCTTWDTPVLMADGTEKAASDIREGDLVAAWNESSQELTAAPIAWSADNGTQPIVRIKTVGGRELRVTPEHPVLVAAKYRSDSPREYEWVKAESVRPGMRAVVALGWSPIASDAISTADAYLLGALVGDGELSSLGRRRKDGRGTEGARFHNLDEGVLGAVDAGLRRHGGRLADGRHGKTGCDRHIVFDYNRQAKALFVEWLRQHDMLHKSYDKRVPLSVMQGGAEVRAAFLSGLLDTDGYVYDRPGYFRVLWDSVSKELVCDIQQLLAGLSVNATVQAVDSKFDGKSYPSWRVAANGAHAVRVLSSLLKPHGVKAERLASAAARLGSARVGRNGAPNNYDLATVTSVEVEEPQPTWALTVAGLHTHVTGGLVTHNTAGLQSGFGIPKGWEDGGIPLGYEFQCRWSLHVMDADIIELVGLVAGMGVQHRTVVRNLAVEADMVDQVSEWHQRHIVDGEEPPLGAVDNELMGRLYPTPNGSTVDLDGTDADDIWQAYRSAHQRETAAKADKKVAGAALKQLLGANEVGELDGAVVAKWSAKKGEVDWPRLVAELVEAAGVPAPNPESYRKPSTRALSVKGLTS